MNSSSAELIIAGVHVCFSEEGSSRQPIRFLINKIPWPVGGGGGGRVARQKHNADIELKSFKCAHACQDRWRTRFHPQVLFRQQNNNTWRYERRRIDLNFGSLCFFSSSCPIETLNPRTQTHMANDGSIKTLDITVHDV